MKLTTKNIIMTQVNKDRRPIYYKNAEEMDKPLSELMEGLRMEIDKTRGKLHDMKRSYGWEDRIEPLEGGLTCMLMAMYGTMMEFKEYEDKQREKAEKV
jgi:NifU-like protein involved in Fe-S cluster formation